METKEIKYLVTEDKEQYTIKEILKNELGMSDRLIRKLKNDKAILFNGENIFVDQRLKNGDILILKMEEAGENEILPEKMDLNIVYEDDILLVVNKPPNVVVHPSILHPNGTLANGVIDHYLQQGLDIKFRPVHRIDRDTSGLLMIAKNQYAHHQMSKQFINKTIERKYIGMVQGRIKEEAGTIDAPIGRKEESIIERIVQDNGQRAVTHYKVIKRLERMTLLQLQLETGRTHQIRVHMKYIHHPLVGDTLYGIGSPWIDRHALHAYVLGFIHPVTGNLLRFEVDLPEDMKRLIGLAKKTEDVQQEGDIYEKFNHDD